jgi:hypothetical protein
MNIMTPDSIRKIPEIIARLNDLFLVGLQLLVSFHGTVLQSYFSAVVEIVIIKFTYILFIV